MKHVRPEAARNFRPVARGVVTTVVLLLFLGMLIGWFIGNLKVSAVDLHRAQATRLAAMVAAAIDPVHSAEAAISSGSDSARSEEGRSRVVGMLDKHESVERLRSFAIKGNQVRQVLDVDLKNDSNHAHEISEEALKAILAGDTFSEITASHMTNGPTRIRAFAPIWGDNDAVVGAVTLDVDTRQLQGVFAAYTRAAWGLGVAAVVISSVMGFWVFLTVRRAAEWWSQALVDVEAKSNFLAMMSHEIRTPLNSVLGFADLVLQSELNPIQRDYVRTIYRSGDSLLRLLNDVLDFSKIECGGLKIIPEPIVPRECADEVVNMYRLTAGTKGIRIAVEECGTPDRPRRILLDRSRLRQIFINLIGNAVKFTSSGQIYVRLIWGSPAPRHLTIEIEDTGIGISDELRGRLFQPFSQADSTATRKFGGTGLGLAISYRLAGLLGGTLGLRPKLPKGACFFLELPAHPAASAVQVDPRDPENLSDPVKCILLSDAISVLVVDDNPINCRLTGRMLKLLGVSPKTASSALECFEILQSESIDLVLMDVQMPEIDGLEATRRIRAGERNGDRSVRIVALTADVLSSDRDKCLAVGMDGYLTKPLRREDLARTLTEFQSRITLAS